jgi:hypothetical protein
MNKITFKYFKTHKTPYIKLIIGYDFLDELVTSYYYSSITIFLIFFDDITSFIFYSTNGLVVSIKSFPSYK